MCLPNTPFVIIIVNITVIIYFFLFREEQKEKEKRAKVKKVKRFAMIGAAAVGGGALIGMKKNQIKSVSYKFLSLLLDTIETCIIQWPFNFTTDNKK